MHLSNTTCVLQYSADPFGLCLSVVVGMTLEYSDREICLASVLPYSTHNPQTDAKVSFP